MTEKREVRFADGGGLGSCFGVCIFRLRRSTGLSPMVEVWDPVLVCVTSVFGEWADDVPKREVWDHVSWSVTSVFGDL